MSGNGRYLRLIEYFIKGLDPDEQRDIIGYLKEHFGEYVQARDFLDYEDEGYVSCLEKSYYDTVDDLKKYMKQFTNHLIAVNNMMLKRGRLKLFDRPERLKESFKWVDTLLSFAYESKWNKLLGCNSFNSYEPQTYEKGYAIIDTYFDTYFYRKDYILALTRERTPTDSLEGGLTTNVYEYMNWIFLKWGYKPLFDDVDDEKACLKTCEEILKVRPLSELLAYYNCNSFEDIRVPTCPKKIFALTKYTNENYGTTLGSANNYYVGSHVRALLKPQTPPEKVCEYARMANKFCNKVIFKNTNNFQEILEHAKYLVTFIDENQL